MDNQNRKKLDDVKNLLIKTNKGNQIPLSSVADINIIEGTETKYSAKMHKEES